MLILLIYRLFVQTEEDILQKVGADKRKRKPPKPLFQVTHFLRQIIGKDLEIDFLISIFVSLFFRFNV